MQVNKVICSKNLLNNNTNGSNLLKKEINTLKKVLENERLDNKTNQGIIKSEFEPPNRQGHYNKQGYKLVAEILNKYILKIKFKGINA